MSTIQRNESTVLVQDKDERPTITSFKMHFESNGIQNPLFIKQASVDSQNGHEVKSSVFTINSTERDNRPALPVLQKSNKIFQFRPANNILRDIDIKIFNRVYTVKKRTAINFKKFIEIIQPYIVFAVMLTLLIAVFRIDLITQDDDASE